MKKDTLPENKTYSTRACKPAIYVKGQDNLRCGYCPFENCLLDNPRTRILALLSELAKTSEIFGLKDWAKSFNSIADALQPEDEEEFEVRG